MSLNYLYEMQRTIVVDASGTWLSSFESKMGCLDPEMMRMPVTMHPHPKQLALKYYAQKVKRTKVGLINSTDSRTRASLTIVHTTVRSVIFSVYRNYVKSLMAMLLCLLESYFLIFARIVWTEYMLHQSKMF